MKTKSRIKLLAKAILGVYALLLVLFLAWLFYSLPWLLCFTALAGVAGLPLTWAIIKLL